MGADQSSQARFETSAANGDFVDDNDRPHTFSQIPSFTAPVAAGAARSALAPHTNASTSQSGLVPSSGRQSELHVDLAPSQINVCNGRTPFVLALDLTGSMSRWAHSLADTQLDLLLNEINQHHYLDDPALAFAFVGDAEFDRLAPLQCTQFTWDARRMKEEISKLWIEPVAEYDNFVRFGGGNQHESYDLAAAWGAYRINFKGPNVPIHQPGKTPGCQRGFFFFTADEAPYSITKKSHLLMALGLDVAGDMKLERVFDELNSHFEVFLIRSPCENVYYARTHNLKELNAYVEKAWSRVIKPHHTIIVNDSDILADVVLGVMALSGHGGGLKLHEYRQHMEARSVTKIEAVASALGPFSDWTSLK